MVKNDRVQDVLPVHGWQGVWSFPHFWGKSLTSEYVR